uniref:Uncharacterized protein n=1 Tax=Oryza glumipatula TaxID=40148 RepID=A0A0E0BKM6_9ORYZ
MSIFWRKFIAKYIAKLLKFCRRLQNKKPEKKRKKETLAWLPTCRRRRQRRREAASSPPTSTLARSRRRFNRRPSCPRRYGSAWRPPVAVLRRPKSTAGFPVLHRTAA